MEISLKWIDELIDIKTVCLEELIKKLTLGGFEVEEIVEMQAGTQTQITLGVSATANRPDSLAIQGISSEIGALLNQPFRNVKYRTRKLYWANKFEDLSHNLSKKSDCQTFFAITIENIVNSTSPKWLQQKLIYSGIVPENNFYDFQTYVQLESGYPFELYDLEKIYLNTNTQDFTLSLLQDAKTKKIFANNVSIGIAGISPVDNVRCSPTTTKILLEGSIFKAAAIRQRSRTVGLRTDRSARYEKSVKDSWLTEASYRLISLLRIGNPNLRCQFHTNSKVETPKFLNIQLKYKTIKKILGPLKKRESKETSYISPRQITNYLTRLTFRQVYDVATETWDVSVPDIRSDDIVEEIDLVEEIGRLHGFDNFLTQLPPIKRVGFEDISYKARKKLTTCFLSIGLTEFVHYSLVNSQRQGVETITLINPLLSEYSNLRVSLLPNLIQTVRSNLNQGNPTIEGFEYGHVFSKNLPFSITEKEVVAGIFGGIKIKSTWSTPAKAINWFEAKGRLEQIFEKLNISVSWKPVDSIQCEPMLHPYCTSQLLFEKNTHVGIFGKINPILAKKLNLPALTYLFELDFKIIKRSILETTMVMAEKYSVYPKIVKDLSVIVSNDVAFEEIKNIIYLNGSNFLTEVNLIDEYNGESIPNCYTSLCLQFVFQSNEQTLQSRHIEEIIANLRLILVDKFNLTMRN